MKYATNYIDLTDFRSRIELGVKINDPFYELNLFKKQLNMLSSNFKEKDSNAEYLKSRIRKLEYLLGINEKEHITLIEENLNELKELI